MKKVGFLKVCIPFLKISLMERKICFVMLISNASALLSTSSKCVDRPARVVLHERAGGRQSSVRASGLIAIVYRRHEEWAQSPPVVSSLHRPFDLLSPQPSSPLTC